jgi:deazaflavin-dependent oxidoreductase (nitroreductase family)
VVRHAELGHPPTLGSGRLLTSPIVEGGRVVLVGSNGGGATSPGWVANLRANPEVEITMGDETHPYRARVVTGD